MRNFGELLEEAKWGKLTQEELTYVIQSIKNHKAGDKNDLYTMIHILGRAGATEYQKLVESFLYFQSDPMISKIALQTLCNYWGFTEHYLSYIKKFIAGVEWDEDDDVRLIALSIAGNWLRENSNPSLLEQLLHVFEDPSQEALIRDVAYIAICRAIGMEWGTIPRIFELIEEGQFDEIDFAPIEMAKKRLIAERS
jgi:hypothetical protein